MTARYGERRLTVEQVAQAIVRYRDDERSMSAVANELGVNREAIRYHLRRHGIAIRSTPAEIAQARLAAERDAITRLEAQRRETA